MESHLAYFFPAVVAMATSTLLGVLLITLTDITMNIRHVILDHLRYIIALVFLGYWLGLPDKHWFYWETCTRSKDERGKKKGWRCKTVDASASEEGLGISDSKASIDNAQLTLPMETETPSSATFSPHGRRLWSVEARSCTGYVRVIRKRLQQNEQQQQPLRRDALDGVAADRIAQMFGCWAHGGNGLSSSPVIKAEDTAALRHPAGVVGRAVEVEADEGADACAIKKKISDTSAVETQEARAILALDVAIAGSDVAQTHKGLAMLCPGKRRRFLVACGFDVKKTMNLLLADVKWQGARHLRGGNKLPTAGRGGKYLDVKDKERYQKLYHPGSHAF